MSSAEEVVILARLTGTREVLANAQAMGLAMEELGVETNIVGREMAMAGRRGYLMNQALFTMRRLMYGVTLATVGAGVEAIRWGFQFDSAMQQARVALQPVSGEIGGVQKELDYLFNFTKYTPFQFKDVTIAFRQMYLGMRTVGVSAQDVNETLKAMVDALSATGRVSPGALNRVAVALQHMAYQGHLTGMTTLQLARDGLPIYAALRKELGLTADQMHHVGQLGIPTGVVLKALNKYIEETPGFANAAYRQATGSLRGLFTTFRDNVSQIMGTIELGFFRRIQMRLIDMNKWFDNFSARTHGTTSLTAILGAIDPRILPFWRQLTADLTLFWHIITAVIRAITHSPAVWSLLYLGLVSIHGILILVNPLLQTMGWWINILIPLWVTYKTIVILAALATKADAFWTAVLTTETRLLSFWQFVAALAVGRYGIMAAISTGATWLYVVATTALSAATDYLAVSFWALLVAMETNPIILLITVFLLLTVGLVVLYFKWKRFHNLVNETWDWIRKHWYLLGSILIGPIFLAAGWIIKHFDAIKNKILSVVNAVARAWHWLGNVWHSIFGGGDTTQHFSAGGQFFNGQGTGGVMPGTGLGLMDPVAGPFAARRTAGRGPVAHTKVAAAGPSVAPVFNMREAWMKPEVNLRGDVHIDGKKIAKIVWQHEATGTARS